MSDHLGRAGTASNRNGQTAFRAIVEDDRGDRHDILVLGFSDGRDAFVGQLNASERACAVTADVVSFRRAQ